MGASLAFGEDRIPADLQRGFQAFLQQADPHALEPDTLWGGEVIAAWRN